MNAPTPNDVEQIAARMATLRGDVDRGLESVAASARRLADWRFYVRQFPILIPAAAIAIGYFTVSRRRRSKRAIALAAPRNSTATNADAAMTNAMKQSTVASVATTILGMVATMAAKAAVAYVGRQIQDKIERRHAEHPPADERFAD